MKCKLTYYHLVHRRVYTYKIITVVRGENRSKQLFGLVAVEEKMKLCIECVIDVSQREKPFYNFQNTILQKNKMDFFFRLRWEPPG